MTCQVQIQPSGQHFAVEAGETILEAGLRQGVTLPYSCKNGACGACKGKVLSGEVTHRAYQPQALSAAEAAEGMALLCCAEAQTDLSVAVRVVGAVGDIPVKTLPCRVEKLEKIHDVAVLSLKIPVTERLQFLAGQYIDILMKEGKHRSFSLANAPYADGLLELHIRHMPGGTFSDHVFNTLKEKDLLRFRGPLGSFFLREDGDTPMLFIASGTGFAPVKAMIEQLLHSGCSRKMVLYWGARTRDDLYLNALPEGWQAAHPQFSYVPVLSEPLASDNWTGRTGLVHEAVLADHADLADWQVYACGAPVMVEAAHTHFTGQRNLPKDAFFSDAFWLSTEATPAAPAAPAAN